MITTDHQLAEQHVAARKAIDDLIREQNLACEELTKWQLTEVIKQALASGDIIRQVRLNDNGQSVIYVPFAEHERLQGRIRFLEELLKKHGIEEPKDDGSIE
jgi:hypothetical protein